MCPHQKHELHWWNVTFFLFLNYFSVLGRGGNLEAHTVIFYGEGQMLRLDESTWLKGGSFVHYMASHAFLYLFHTPANSTEKPETPTPGQEYLSSL